MQIARRDAIQFTTSKVGGFAVDAVLIDANGLEVEITLLHSKHHLTYDQDRAAIVNMKNAHLTFAEAKLMELEPAYVLRNAAGEVHMEGHKVRVADSTGTTVTYKIKEWYPDETLGLIVVILSDYAA